MMLKIQKRSQKKEKEEEENSRTEGKVCASTLIQIQASQCDWTQWCQGEQGKRWICQYEETGHRQTLCHVKGFGHFTCNQKGKKVF